jgi:hypothetical protein
MKFLLQVSVVKVETSISREKLANTKLSEEEIHTCSTSNSRSNFFFKTQSSDLNPNEKKVLDSRRKSISKNYAYSNELILQGQTIKSTNYFGNFTSCLLLCHESQLRLLPFYLKGLPNGSLEEFFLVPDGQGWLSENQDAPMRKRHDYNWNKFQVEEMWKWVLIVSFVKTGFKLLIRSWFQCSSGERRGGGGEEVFVGALLRRLGD